MKIAYIEGGSLFHTIDPLTKFAWCLLIAVWLLSIRQLLDVVIVSTILAAVAILGARINIAQYIKAVFVLLTGGIFLVIFQGYFQSGPGIELWNIHFSFRGIELGVALTLRTFGLVASSLAFSRTTSPKEMAMAMQKLGFPYRYAHVAHLALRFIPLFEIDFQTIKDAQQLRPVKNTRQRLLKTVLAFIVTELRRADETAIALETRGFGLYPTRTNLESITISKSGIVLVVATALLMIGHFLVL